eukprot:5382095-Pyramimonas_sp.AAC.1
MATSPVLTDSGILAVYRAERKGGIGKRGVTKSVACSWFRPRRPAARPIPRNMAPPRRREALGESAT